MPPPVEEYSEDESGGDVPFSTKKEKASEKKPKAEPEDDDEEDEDDDEGVFIVEQIMGHEFMKDGSLQLLVKWKGYEKKEDMTWEPEEGLKDGANEVVTAYYKVLGGRPKKPSPEPAKRGPGRKRKSIGESKLTPAPTPPAETKRRRKSAAKEENNMETPALTEDNSDEEGNWVPKTKNWDEQLDTVDTIIRDTDGPGLCALLLWKNGKKSRVSLETCYDRCPKKMLKFYEKHLVFKDN